MGESGSGDGSSGSAAVASEVEQALAVRGGSDASLLRRLIFSPEYGAPPSSRGVQSGALGEADTGGAGTAATSAVSGGGGRTFVVLAVVVLALAALAVAAVRRQRRSP